jgi:hypothetical protein
MPKRFLGTRLLMLWFLAVAAVVVWSVAADAKLATSALLLFIGAAPAVVTLMLGLSGPAPTVAEILHAVHSEGRR